MKKIKVLYEAIEGMMPPPVLDNSDYSIGVLNGHDMTKRMILFTLEIMFGSEIVTLKKRGIDKLKKLNDETCR